VELVVPCVIKRTVSMPTDGAGIRIVEKGREVGMTQSSPHGQPWRSDDSHPGRRKTELDGTGAAKMKKPEPMHTPTTGFILMDSSQNPIAFNAEAVQILCYPDPPSNSAGLGSFLASRIRSRLFKSPSDSPLPGVTALKSGRRLYFCRTFNLAAGVTASSAATVALLLERSSSELISMSEVVRQFNLSPRERQAVEYLLMGLTSKEIADRMKISVNTVKAFLRLVMVKMGVSTRSGIVGKIVTVKSDVYAGNTPISDDES
jgi:DNA-binding CsgD family transcriptional regulator